jgi:hypothetical protein
MIQRQFWRDRLEQAWRRRSVVWLSGVRRVGKTSLCRSLEGVDYFDCELPSARIEMADPEHFLRGVRGRPGGAPDLRIRLGVRWIMYRVSQHLRVRVPVVLALSILPLCAFGAAGPKRPSAAKPGSIRAAVFSSDATPKVGDRMYADQTIVAIDGPLLLKGLVLEDSGSRYVVAALDWVLLNTESRDLFRNKIAEAAATSPAKVAVQVTHTHSSPISSNSQKLVAESADRAAAAVRAALPKLRPVTHVGVGRARVEKFASNRRVWLPNGTMGARWSSTKDVALRDMPEGLIDPWLRTVSLFDRGRPIVRMHYYGSHPQSFYRDGKIHPETVGWARERIEKEEGIPQLYFTGGGGNITAGKYNNGSLESRAQMIDRLSVGMRKSIAKTKKTPLSGLSWKSVEARFVVPVQKGSSETQQGPPVDLSRLRLGPVDIVHLPGEPFIEYQLYAQTVRSDRFVAVAGYGDSSTGYFCTDVAYSEGGYEPGMSGVRPGSEKILKETLAELLR